MANISLKIGVAADRTRTIASLNTIKGLSNWWTTDVRGGTQTGEMVQFWFNDQMLQMEIMASENDEINWKCTSGPEEWLGTQILFQLKDEGDTAIYFQHKNWANESPFHHHCSMKWATFLLSLRDYLETGSGRPFPEDIKIGNEI